MGHVLSAVHIVRAHSIRWKLTAGAHCFSHTSRIIPHKSVFYYVCVCVYKTTFVRVINALGFENLYYHRHYIILYATRVARRPYVIWYLTAVAACWDNNIHSVWPNEVSSSSSPPPCPCRSNRITRIIILIIRRVRRSVCAYTTPMINGCCRICVRVHSERGSRCRDFFVSFSKFVLCTIVDRAIESEKFIPAMIYRSRVWFFLTRCQRVL